MIVTNLDHLPDRNISMTLGIVHGYASGENMKGQGDDLFSALFEKAEKMMISEGEKISCDAIVKVDGKITRDEKGAPEILLVGTAVRLADDRESGNKEDDSLTMHPSNPSAEVVKMIRQRDLNDRKDKRRRKDIYDLADEIGISFDKAELLMKNGFGTLESISDASSRNLSEINGINPTQARILIRKAREILDQERGL